MLACLPVRAITVVLVLLGLTGCERAGPERDAAQALQRGDQRALALISVGPHGQLVWAALGLSCRDSEPVPLRKVGRTPADHDRYVAYVTAFNAALSANPRYRFRTHCGPRSTFPDGVGRAIH